MIKLHEALRSWHSLTQLHHYNIVETGWEKNRGQQRNFSWWACHFNAMMWSNTAHKSPDPGPGNNWPITGDAWKCVSSFELPWLGRSNWLQDLEAWQMPAPGLDDEFLFRYRSNTGCCNYEKTHEIMQILLLRLYLAENMEQSGGAGLGEPTSNTPCPGLSFSS